MPRAASPVVLSLALAAVACNRREPPNLEPWVRPVPRASADPSCDAVARSHPTAVWQRAAATFELAVTGPIAIADASVLGGPFHAPIVVRDVPAGAHAIDVLVGPAKAGPSRPLCAIVHLRDGEATSWTPLGDVPVDTDVVAIADQRRFEMTARGVATTIIAGVQAESADLPAVVRELAGAGVPVEVVLPTLATTTRAVQPGDKAAVRDALRRAHAFGHYVEEPATTGWLFLRALGDRPVARVDLDGAKGVAVAIEAGEGAGAYVVAIGTPSEGVAPVALELRLSP